MRLFAFRDEIGSRGPGPLHLDVPGVAFGELRPDGTIDVQDGAPRPMGDLTPAPAVPRPGKIICVGLNYRDHLEEQHLPMPDRPTIFGKWTNAVVADGEPIIRPEGCDALDAEVELGVVIGRRAHRVPAAEAMGHVAGYVVVNDVTARDWQGNKGALHPGARGDGQWLRAKSSDTFLPMSPTFVTVDEIPDPGALRLRSWWIRGSGPDGGREILMQDGTTADMLFDIPAAIEFISRVITLDPGDVIATGTPSGWACSATRRSSSSPATASDARSRASDRSRTPSSTGRRQTSGMLALVKTTAAPGLELREVPEPTMGINDVRIRVHKTGICGTDLHIESWDAWAAKNIKPPLIVGHEFVGEIVDVGSNVSDFHPGDIVSGEGHVVCGRCRHCLAGRRNLCANSIGLGVGRDGAFAEQVVLPMTNVWHHWPGIDEEVAAIFDPFGNAVHTALAFPVLGEDVLIVGAGPIGLMATAVVRHAGARHVVVTEPNGFRRDLAKAMGASVVVDPGERSLADVQSELGMVEGFDVALEMSGNPTALRAAIANMAHGGAIAILGIPSEPVALDFNDIIFKMLTLRGIYGREMYETWYKMTVMLQSGLDIRPAITHRFSFRDHEAAFAATRSGDSGKVIMDWQT